MENLRGWEGWEEFLKKETSKIATEAEEIAKEISFFYKSLDLLQKQDFLKYKDRFCRYGGVNISISEGEEKVCLWHSNSSVSISTFRFIDQDLVFRYLIEGGVEGCPKRLEDINFLLIDYRRDIRKLMFQVQFPEFFEELESIKKELGFVKEDRERRCNFLKDELVENRRLTEQIKKLENAIERAAVAIWKTRSIFGKLYSKAFEKIREDLMAVLPAQKQEELKNLMGGACVPSKPSEPRPEPIESPSDKDSGHKWHSGGR